MFICTALLAWELKENASIHGADGARTSACHYRPAVLDTPVCAASLSENLLFGPPSGLLARMGAALGERIIQHRDMVAQWPAPSCCGHGLVAGHRVPPRAHTRMLAHRLRLPHHGRLQQRGIGDLRTIDAIRRSSRCKRRFVRGRCWRHPHEPSCARDTSCSTCRGCLVAAILLWVRLSGVLQSAIGASPTLDYVAYVVCFLMGFVRSLTVLECRIRGSRCRHACSGQRPV